MLGGTSGWDIALKESCKQCGLMDVYQYYSNLNWVESDTFDGYIADETLNIVFSDDINNYYKFKLNYEGD